MAEKDLDLTKTEPSGPAAVQPIVQSGADRRISWLRELVRGAAAVALLVILLFVIAAAFVTIWRDQYDSGMVSDLLKLVFGPLVALVGAATGFYYGTRDR